MHGSGAMAAKKDEFLYFLAKCQWQESRPSDFGPLAIFQFIDSTSARDLAWALSSL
jgi:hypothetical protein